MSDFSKQKVFLDSGINALMDRIQYELKTNVDVPDLNAVLCLSGRVAAIWQGMEPAPCDNIIFITNSAQAYSYIQDELPKRIKNTGVVRFKERTLFYFDNLHVEFWRINGPIGNTIVNYINVQHKDKIPAILL